MIRRGDAPAVLVALALIVYPFSVTERPLIIAPLAALAALGFGVTLAARKWAVAGPAVIMVVIEYGAALVTDPGRIDPLAPVVGAGLLILLELLDAAVSARLLAPTSRAVVARRVSGGALSVALGTVVAGAALLAGAGSSAPGPVVATLGAMCGAVVTVLVGVLAARALRG